MCLLVYFPRKRALLGQVNGDANYMKDEFYDLADAYGILIHHEFMLSDTDYTKAVSASLSSSVSDAFLPNVEAEVRHQVRRLSHHPSVAMWLSNNEIGPYQGAMSRPCAADLNRSCWDVLFLDSVRTTRSVTSP